MLAFPLTTLSMRLTPLQIQIVGEELAIAWNDGTETYLPLESLRRHCPCAVCGGEPDVMGRVERPHVSYKESSFRLRTYQVIGGYALQPTWEDGHGSGLYPFPYLKRIEVEASGPGQQGQPGPQP